MYYYLIIKYEQTGQKYLCKRKQNVNDANDHIDYRGSGTLWRRILNKHPEYNIKTIVLGLYTTEELKEVGLYYSNKFNIVESKEWANLTNETGAGGDTSKTPGYIKSLTNRDRSKTGLSKGSKFCYDPITNRSRVIKPNQPLPDGYVWGNVPGRGYGPEKGKTIVYNNGTNKKYVPIGNTPPEGFVRGLHYTGSTKDRICYYNPVDNKKTYLKRGVLPPPGFIQGASPTTCIIVNTPFGTFVSFAECMRELNLTRHQISQNIKKIEGWYTNDDTPE